MELCGCDEAQAPMQQERSSILTKKVAKGSDERAINGFFAKVTDVTVTQAMRRISMARSKIPFWTPPCLCKTVVGLQRPCHSSRVPFTDSPGQDGVDGGNGGDR